MPASASTVATAGTSVPDPKLIISDPDPDPQIKNQEFRIRIRILDADPSVTRDGEKKLSILVIMKTQMGIFNFLKFSSIVYEIMMNLFTF